MSHARNSSFIFWRHALPRTLLSHTLILSALLGLSLLFLPSLFSHSETENAAHFGRGISHLTQSLSPGEWPQGRLEGSLVSSAPGPLSRLAHPGYDLCRHPERSSVPLWECNHDIPASLLAPATLHASEIPPTSLTLFPLASFVLPLSLSLFALSSFLISPRRPPRPSFASA